MPRGPDHRQDPPDSRELYRAFDTEDLVRILGWLTEIDESCFTVAQVRAVSKAATGGYTWSVKRVRRLMRVGVELGWFSERRLSPNNHLAFELTGRGGNIATIETPVLVDLLAKELDTDAETARERRRNILMFAFLAHAPYSKP